MIFRFRDKKYIWRSKILLKNLGKLMIIIFFIAGYLLLAKNDFETMIGGVYSGLYI